MSRARRSSSHARPSISALPGRSRSRTTSNPPAPGRFDFGLSAEDEARAERLHRESIIVDYVAQGPGGRIFDHYPPELRSEIQERIDAQEDVWAKLAVAESSLYELWERGTSSLVKEWMEQSGLTCGVFAAPVGDDPVFRRWDALSARTTNVPWRRRVTTAEEIRRAKRDGVIAAYGYWQPVAPIPRGLDALDDAYDRGLRICMLTYNRMDNVGVGCTERVDAGLSNHGISVVRRLNELGVIVDVSHCGPATPLAPCPFSPKPVTANHTAARAVYPPARGKTDEALEAIAYTGGVVGVLCVPAFVTDASPPTIEHMLDHVDYIAALVGWEHVGIGTDWPNTAPVAVLRSILSPTAAANTDLGFRDQDRLDVTRNLVGFDDVRDFPNITRGLVKRGYSDEQIRGILGENALRVFADVCG